jgi:hypothetical protein
LTQSLARNVHALLQATHLQADDNNFAEIKELIAAQGTLAPASDDRREKAFTAIEAARGKVKDQNAGSADRQRLLVAALRAVEQWVRIND